MRTSRDRSSCRDWSRACFFPATVLARATSGGRPYSSWSGASWTLRGQGRLAARVPPAAATTTSSCRRRSARPRRHPSSRWRRRNVPPPRRRPWSACSPAPSATMGRCRGRAPSPSSRTCSRARASAPDKQRRAPPQQAPAPIAAVPLSIVSPAAAGRRRLLRRRVFARVGRALVRRQERGDDGRRRRRRPRAVTSAVARVRGTFRTASEQVPDVKGFPSSAQAIRGALWRHCAADARRLDATLEPARAHVDERAARATAAAARRDGR